MSAPAKLSERAERLRQVINNATNAGTDPIDEAREMARSINTELGITPEMVDAVRAIRDEIPATSALNPTWSAVHDAAESLSTLLEVAGK